MNGLTASSFLFLAMGLVGSALQAPLWGFWLCATCAVFFAFAGISQEAKDDRVGAFAAILMLVMGVVGSGVGAAVHWSAHFLVGTWMFTATSSMAVTAMAGLTIGLLQVSYLESEPTAA